VGAQVYTGGQLGQVYDAATGQVLVQHHSPLNCAAAFERGGQAHLAVGSYTGEILLFALGEGPELTLVQTLAEYENAVKGLQVCDGVLFSVCANTDVAWHDLADGRCLRRIAQGHERIANACCAIGGGRFASVSRDRNLRLWALEELAATNTYASPHPNSVKCMAVNEAHTLLLTGSYGGTLALFDLLSRRWSALQRPTVAGISSITWDSAAQQFLAASYDGRLYPIAP
jgi:WD40 repeat protein